jgi:hypothetical protein
MCWRHADKSWPLTVILIAVGSGIQKDERSLEWVNSESEMSWDDEK